MSTDKAMVTDAMGAEAKITAQAEEIERLNELTSCSVTVGRGLSVYGTIEAVGRVQTYILLDSNHPVEKADVRRTLARELQAAEARVRELEGALKEAGETPSDALALARRVANLNPDAGEIGEGMLRSLVEDARRIVG